LRSSLPFRLRILAVGLAVIGTLVLVVPALALGSSDTASSTRANTGDFHKCSNSYEHRCPSPRPSGTPVSEPSPSPSAEPTPKPEPSPSAHPSPSPTSTCPPLMQFSIHTVGNLAVGRQFQWVITNPNSAVVSVQVSLNGVPQGLVIVSAGGSQTVSATARAGLNTVALTPSGAPKCSLGSSSVNVGETPASPPPSTSPPPVVNPPATSPVSTNPLLPLTGVHPDDPGGFDSVTSSAMGLVA
jgi:hypothetical protein